jgi:hypothetical protein
MMFSGVQLPKIDYRFDAAYPIENVKIPQTLDGSEYDPEKGVRKYDEEADEALKSSMKKFGFIDPIVLSGDGVVIHGLHRFLIAVQLQQATIPAIIVKNWDHTVDETQFFNIMSNKLNDWSTWLAPNVDRVLRNLDGGVKSRVIRGDDGTFVVVADESGEYRDLARKLGLFIDVIPRQLCASAVDLLTLAKMRVKTLGRRYQYNDEQILYIETLRDQIDQYRRKAVEVGIDTSGNVAQKLQQETTWNENIEKDGIKVARIVLLHSIGVPNAEIAKIVDVPVDNKATRKAAKDAGLDTFMEQVTVENALLRSSKREFDPLASYGYWIDKTLRERYEVLKDVDVRSALAHLDQYRVDVKVTVKTDEITPPDKKLVLDSEEAKDEFNAAVDLIEAKLPDKELPRIVVEDWVRWPQTLKFYANECFKDVLLVDKKLHPENISAKTPMDVKTTRQTTDKACAKTEWNEIWWLDKVNSGEVKIPLIEPDYTIVADRDDLSEDEALAIVTEDANKRLDAEVDKLRKAENVKSSAIYDKLVARDFNKILIGIRKKYEKGPINLFSIGKNRDGNVDDDPDAKGVKS